jgi:hypothetical protein
MEPAIGMYELTSQRRTPTTTRTITTWTKGMIYSFFCWEIGPAIRRPGNPHGDPLVIVIGLGNRPHLAPFPWPSIPSLPWPQARNAMKVWTSYNHQEENVKVYTALCIYIFYNWFVDLYIHSLINI